MKYLEVVIDCLSSINSGNTLDLHNNRMIIPKELIPRPALPEHLFYERHPEPEMYMEHELLQMNFESGSSLSHLNYDYFEQHQGPY